jgi:hypothetical protein
MLFGKSARLAYVERLSSMLKGRTHCSRQKKTEYNAFNNRGIIGSQSKEATAHEERYRISIGTLFLQSHRLKAHCDPTDTAQRKWNS